MRCKPNDLVVVIRSKAGNEGRIGTVVRWVKKREFVFGALPDGTIGVNAQDGWLVEGSFQRTHGVPMPHGVFPDEWLRPLRDNEGDDETLTWAGKPEQLETIK